MNKIDTPDDAGQDAGRTKKKPRIKRSFLLAGLLAVVAIAWVASGSLNDTAPVETKTVAERNANQPSAVDVRVQHLSAVEHPRTIVVTGRTNAIKDAEIKAETSGQVVARPARKGSFVEKGAVLVELAMDDRPQRLRDAEARVGVAKITYEASKDLQRKQFESQIKLAQSTADLAAAEAELAAIRLEIARTKIRAPIAGYVETLLPGPGDYVSNNEMVATVVDLDPMRVIVYVTEREIEFLKVDDLATIRLPSGREIGGTVHYISRVANEVTRAFRVDVWTDNPDGSIPAGLTAEVHLNGGARKAHEIPASALTLNDEGMLGVRTVTAENTVKFMPVALLDDAPDGTWVTGLPDEVTLIVVGHEFVTEGQKVIPSTGEAPKAGGDAS